MGERKSFLSEGSLGQDLTVSCVDIDCVFLILQSSTLDKWFLHSIRETGLVSALGYLWSSLMLPSRPAFRSWCCHLTLSGCLRFFSKIDVISFKRTIVKTGEVEA